MSAITMSKVNTRETVKQISLHFLTMVAHTKQSTKCLPPAPKGCGNVMFFSRVCLFTWDRVPHQRNQEGPGQEGLDPTDEGPGQEEPDLLPRITKYRNTTVGFRLKGFLVKRMSGHRMLSFKILT